MNRLFVAIDPPDSILSRLQFLESGLKNVKWFTPEQLHLTIRFIGEVDGAMFYDVKQCLQSVNVEPFDVKIKSVGFFPPRGKPETLWAGIEKNNALTHLRNKIESALVRTGITPESRKFFPHVTLGRVKNSSPEYLADYLATNALFETESFKVNEFILYSSFLATEGAIHTEEEIYPLKIKRKINK